MVPEVLGTVLGDGDEQDDAGEIFHAGELEMKYKVVGDYGAMQMSAHSGCPNCNADLGYYGDLVNGFECPECGAVFEIESETEYWYRCVKAATTVKMS